MSIAENTKDAFQDEVQRYRHEAKTLEDISLDQTNQNFCFALLASAIEEIDKKINQIEESQKRIEAKLDNLFK